MSRKRRKTLDKKIKKEYNIDMGEEKMYQESRYKMDQRNFSFKNLEDRNETVVLFAGCQNKDFYFSIENGKVFVIAVSPEDVLKNIESKTFQSIEKMCKEEFGGFDFKIYGIMKESGVYYVYDLKINDNYFHWIDFKSLMNKYELPTIPVIKTINIFDKTKEEENVSYFYRTTVETLPEVKGWANESSKVTTYYDYEDNRKEDSGAGNTTNTFQGEQKKSSEQKKDLGSEKLQLDGLEDTPFYCITTLFDESGEIDYSTLRQYVEYFSSKKYIDMLKLDFEMDGIETCQENKEFLSIITSNFLSEKIANFAYDLEEKKHFGTYVMLEEKIRRRISAYTSKIVEELLEERMIDEAGNLLLGI